MEHQYLAIIPARKGSKGIPGKNMQPIAGKPMVQYTLEAAAQSRKIDQIIVSSDDESILQLAETLGIGLPQRRPDELATDTARTPDVIRYVLEEYHVQYGAYPEHVMVLQPTSPFRTAEDIDAALHTYEASGKSSLITVCDVSQHPSECISLDAAGRLELSLPEDSGGRQDYKRYYFIDGALYVSRTERFLRAGIMFDTESAIHVLPKSHAIDVDDWFDLAVARALAAYAKQDNAVTEP